MTRSAMLFLALAACRSETADKEEEPSDTAPVDADGDGFAADEDCDDADDTVRPDAEEVCDGIDNNCDGTVDEGLDVPWFIDADGDGFGNPEEVVEACEAPEGGVEVGEDCDDTDPTIHPDAPETCDDIDNDCDDYVDDVDPDLTDAPTWYIDYDADGFGSDAYTLDACSTPDGYTDNADDCDDTDASIHPDGIEVCDDDAADEDCDGLSDDDDASVDPASLNDFWADVDGDGYGDASTPTQACLQPVGTAPVDGDCDDLDFDINPDATEVCDTVDNDCDGDIDDDDSSVDVSTGSTWFMDADTDTYGDAGAPVSACIQPAGTVADATDCDDGDADVNPGATEVCDTVDNDCDGDADDDDASLDTSTATTFYADADTDGYGDSSATTLACLEPSGYVSDATDCDDDNSTVHPGATDTWYDGIDSDCAGNDDDDQDGDGEAPYALGGTDCDDTDATVSEAAGNCRATCTPPSAATLAGNDPSGVSDLQFDADCNAWVSTIISGTDYVYRIDAGGSQTIFPGASNHDIGSLALDPLSTDFAVSYNNVGYVGVRSGSSIPVVATGGFNSGSNFSNLYLNFSASSIAWDSDGCIWVPNFTSTGSVDCFDTAGSSTTLTTLSGYVESVALDDNESLYVSVGDTIYSVSSSGTATAWFTVSDIVLDMAFDITGEVYVLTDANEILLVDAAATTESLFATVGSEGKLAISPDGTLYHLDSQPVSPAGYQSWAL